MTTNIYPDAAETARALIRFILKIAEETSREEVNIALSGGSTPALMFDLWAEEFADQTPWQRLRLYWVDERCVAPDHTESNYGMTRKHLLSKVPLTADQVFRIQGENAPEQEARRYGDFVAARLPQEDGYPMFDLVQLGAGDDGHTSSIFPGQEALLTTEAIYAVGTHPTSGQQRVALTGQPILRATHVAFLMTGAAKAPILRDLRSSVDTGPAAYVAHHALHDVQVFADEAAGGLI
jgi:6-phosphogluconolactonase